MAVIGKLAATNLSVHRTRTALTAIAIALSVSLVVATTSGYASVEAAAGRFVNRYMASADAMVTRKGDLRVTFAESIVDQIKADPAVRLAVGRLEWENAATADDGKPLDGHMPSITGLRRPIDTRIDNLEPKAGGWFDTPDGDVAVIDQVASERLKANVGDTFLLPAVGRPPLKLKVVGVVQKPAVLAGHVQSLYLPLETLQRFVDPVHPPGVNRIIIDLKPKADVQAFVDRWTLKLTAIDPKLQLRTGRDVRATIEGNLQGLKVLSYLGGCVSMAAAAFIIFSALSMGVTERSRSLAMLRAIGASRGQVARLVVAEGAALAVLGVGVGAPLGWLWMLILHWTFPKLVTTVAISWGGVAFAAAGSVAAALGASLLPAWWATRVSPLAALVPSADPPRNRVPILATIGGLLLITVDPMIVFGPWLPLFVKLGAADPRATSKDFTLLGHLILGLPAVVVGYFLIAPALVVAVETGVGPIVAKLLDIRPALLRQQLSSGVWRAAGTCAALMVGLATLVSMEIEGNSLLNSWRLPDHFPDIFVVAWSGLDGKQTEQLKHVYGIDPTQVLPIAAVAPEFGGSSIFALGLAAAVPNTTMFLGLDPTLGLNMMELEFSQGDTADAIRELNLGRHIIVTDEYHQLRGLNKGDTVSLKTEHGPLDFTIAAVVWSPGIDVIASHFDMGRQFDDRTGASMFGSIDDARKYFGADLTRLFAANLLPGTDYDRTLKELKGMGLEAGNVRQIKQEISGTFSKVLLLVATVPLAALLIASLGVTNTIMASVRTRRWQLGVLRSVGLTRGQLLRMILAEAALVGVVASGLGLLAGGELSANAHHMTRLIIGHSSAVLVPWDKLALGVGIVMLVAMIGGLWPARQAATAEPLSLLQAGRASA